ncbi:hypothetical protein [Agromyces sp. S2-1-8]|uniref:hypothetical protein n=1 Tax=Agromyces sp. S2-1-8 TaxID=2897180 RepID=UPI001E5BA9C2|nr:hypothetical protein [Agromyces sp. S2-1-8]MCD5348403.1 hypothetical protein [Agromyces sp. S2-1-8]
MRFKSVCMAGGIAALLVATGSTVASAEEPLNSSLEVVEEVAPEVFADAHPEVSVDGSTASAEVTMPGDPAEVVATAEVEADASSITMGGLVGEPITLTIESEYDVAPELTDSGELLVENSSGISSVAVIKEDASVQVASTLDGPEASERIPYELTSDVPTTLQITDSGMVLQLDAQGELVGSVAPPWARDAAGRDVPTHFEVSGNELVQVVEHHMSGFEYPIVADPYAGKNLFGGMSYSFTKKAFSITKSAYGAKIHYPTNYWIFTSYGWKEFLARTPARSFVNTSVHQQYDCHAAGGYYNWAGATWDFETYRPARTGGNWGFGSAIHHCNWTTASRY